MNGIKKSVKYDSFKDSKNFSVFTEKRFPTSESDKPSSDSCHEYLPSLGNLPTSNNSSNSYSPLPSGNHNHTLKLPIVNNEGSNSTQSTMQLKNNDKSLKGSDTHKQINIAKLPPAEHYASCSNHQIASKKESRTVGAASIKKKESFSSPQSSQTSECSIMSCSHSSSASCDSCISKPSAYSTSSSDWSYGVTEKSSDSGVKSVNTSTCLPEENSMDLDDCSDLMNMKGCDLCSSSSDLSVRSTSPATIHEDLNSLCLNDENASSNLGAGGDTKSRRSYDSYENIRTTLRESLFPNVPPTVYFGTKEESVQPLPIEIRRLMKWKLSTITPVLIRQTVVRTGFRLTKTEGSEWTGTWGKHLKCVSFKTLKNFQKINHFPGSFHLGRKDKLWQNYSKMQARYGEHDFSFQPETFVLPQDIRLLRHVWEHSSGKRLWIVKPPASARGTGIHVVHKWCQIPKKHPLIVQKYLSNPYLINGTKFDLRLYVLVTSFDPLRVYISDDGLVRFASVKYSSAMRSLNDRFMHLTNYSINRKSASYTANQDESSCHGHKWSLKALWKYLVEEGVNTTSIWAAIVDIVIKTVISCEGPMTRLIKSYTHSRYNCFELFGFDIMLDNNLKPWLLEVNISPSLHSSSLLDTNVKGQLVKDMLNAAGYQIPNKIGQTNVHTAILSRFGVTPEQTQKLCMNRALHRWFLSPNEKSKHVTYLQNSEGDILKNLTPDDIRLLIESEDELARSGSFIRVFPSVSSTRYLKYFEYCRYYNLLLDSWEQRYHSNREDGIKLLKTKCEENFHLQLFRRDPFPTQEEIAAASNSNASTSTTTTTTTATNGTASTVKTAPAHIFNENFLTKVISCTENRYKAELDNLQAKLKVENSWKAREKYRSLSARNARSQSSKWHMGTSVSTTVKKSLTTL